MRHTELSIKGVYQRNAPLMFKDIRSDLAFALPALTIALAFSVLLISHA